MAEIGRPCCSSVCATYATFKIFPLFKSAKAKGLCRASEKRLCNITVDMDLCDLGHFSRAKFEMYSILVRYHVGGNACCPLPAIFSAVPACCQSSLARVPGKPWSATIPTLLYEVFPTSILSPPNIRRPQIGAYLTQIFGDAK